METKRIEYVLDKMSHGRRVVTITKQTHRGDSFGEGGKNNFEVKIGGIYYGLRSAAFPANKISETVATVFLRGWEPSKDTYNMEFTPQEYVIFQKLVKAYNKKFGSGGTGEVINSSGVVVKEADVTKEPTNDDKKVMWVISMDGKYFYWFDGITKFTTKLNQAYAYSKREDARHDLKIFVERDYKLRGMKIVKVEATLRIA